jgi:hypothetical protein
MISKIFAATAVAGLIAMSGAATAQEGTAAGVAGGAATGAVVGGPVGAVVGGVVGGIAGTAIDPPPPEARQYVIRQERPSVRVERQVVVGEALPDTVVVERIPEYDTYGYAYVNDRRVIVDRDSGRVIEIIE